MKFHFIFSITITLLLHAAGPALAVSHDTYEECLLRNLSSAEEGATVSQIKEICRPLLETENSSTKISGPQIDKATETTPQSAVERRISQETTNTGNLFNIIAHRPNYILLGSYNDNQNGDALQRDDNEVDRTEIKFQLSFKIPLAKELFGDFNAKLFAAYTMKSFWQAYNDDISSPFRETNHEPEIFFSFPGRKKIFGWKNSYILAGFAHQSNGRSGSLSRSWNRAYVDFIFERDNFALSIKPWYRLPEGSKSYPGDPRGDDNPDISKYLGYGELTGAWSNGNHSVSVMLRNNLRDSGNKGAVQIGWSFPLGSAIPLKGYLQYFNGYGESLIDYDSSVNRIGLGVLLTDWL